MKAAFKRQVPRTRRPAGLGRGDPLTGGARLSSAKRVGRFTTTPAGLFCAAVPIRRLVRVVVIALAALLTAAAVVYAVRQCQSIPAPLPGREAGSSGHRFGYAAVSLALALLVLGAGVYGTRRPRRPA